MTRPSRISEQGLHDYVDGRLDEAGRARIATHLARHAADRRRVESYRAITAGLRALYDAALHEPVPEAMRALLARPRRKRDPQ